MSDDEEKNKNEEGQGVCQPLNDPEDEETDKLARAATIKFIIILIVGACAIGALSIAILFFSKSDKESGVNKSENKKILKGTYSINIAAADYGCGINKALVTFEKIVDKVTKKTFLVIETKKVLDESVKEKPEIEKNFERKIVNAYLCDKKGKKVEKPSKYALIELNTDINEGSPFIYKDYNYWSDTYYLTISLAENAKLTSNGETIEGLNINTEFTSRTAPSDVFKKENKKYGKYNYNIATYEPEEKSENLFVWLNGGGEGGTDILGKKTNVEVTLLANKVTALTQEKFQDKLGGCNILVPQAPTMWMDDAKGNVVAGDRKSIYLKSVIELIDDYADKMNVTNVFIGGCSNGGYLTMNIAMDYGNKYQGYVAICESMLDEYITDEDIDALKEVPLYLVYSKDDTTVDPKKYEEPTIKRLNKAGATDLHVSYTENVTDSSGKYFDENGKPYQYYGHWSWIYFFNDETSCSECEISAFDWLGELVKERK